MKEFVTVEVRMLCSIAFFFDPVSREDLVHWLLDAHVMLCFMKRATYVVDEAGYPYPSVLRLEIAIAHFASEFVWYHGRSAF